VAKLETVVLKSSGVLADKLVLMENEPNEYMIFDLMP
jgi:hypothetical protein